MVNDRNTTKRQRRSDLDHCGFNCHDLDEKLLENDLREATFDRDETYPRSVELHNSGV